jgi:DNA repair exonuclease SbcCD nuclease subunit
MSALITGDLHLTTAPQDEYRWHLFDWLCAKAEELKVKDLILLGDYTNPKDNHPSALVNRFKTCMDMCSSYFQNIVMIAGNHDYIDPKVPFFMFLDGLNDNKVSFITTPQHIELSIGRCWFIPAGTDWSTLEVGTTDKYIFTHETFDGAISESGHTLNGVAPSLVSRISIPVISGDIHKPQTIGIYIEYVGAPYHTRFNSDYDPQIMLLNDDGSRGYLQYPAPLKKTLNISSMADLDRLKFDIYREDHHKIRVHLSRGELADWQKIRDEIKARAKEQGWQLTGPELILKDEAPSETQTIPEALSPEQLIIEYAKRHNASEQHIEIGKSLL